MWWDKACIVKMKNHSLSDSNCNIMNLQHLMFFYKKWHVILGLHLVLVTLHGQFTIRPPHTQDWEPVTITLQALPLVEKAELVQVCFTLRLRDQQSIWMQDGFKVYMDSYLVSNRSCFMVTWTRMNTIHWNSIWFKDRLHMTSQYSWGAVTTLHEFGGVLGWPLNTFFWTPQFRGHGSWLMCEVALGIEQDK